MSCLLAVSIVLHTALMEPHPLEYVNHSAKMMLLMIEGTAHLVFLLVVTITGLAWGGMVYYVDARSN